MESWAKLLRTYLRVGFCLAFCCVSHADAMDVYFGGFAFIGDYSAAKTNFRYTYPLAGPTSNGVSILDAALRERLQGFNNPSFTLVTDRLGRLDEKSTSSIALGFALDRETVSIESIGGFNKVVVDLSAQALFFDFKEKVVIASFPVTIQYIDAKRTTPTEAQIAKVIEQLYAGDLGVNIIDEFAATLALVNLNPNAVIRRVQVRSVEVSEGALQYVPQALRSTPRLLNATIGQEFSKYLSKNQHIPVLPFITGNAIGNRMVARFAEGTAFELKIPEPDYEIHLTLNGFKRVEMQKSAAGQSFVYGAFFSVRALEPLSNKIYFDAMLKNGATKIVPAGQESVDDWPAFQEALLVLMDKFTLAVTTPTADWAERYSGNKATVVDMKNLQKVLQSCK